MILLFGGLVVMRELRRPPLEKSRQAMDSLEAARLSRSDLGKNENYRSAKGCLTAGQAAMKEVSDSWWPFSSYRTADSLFDESIRLSKLVLSQAQKERARREVNIKQTISGLRDSVSTWRDFLDYSLPRLENELLYRNAFFRLQMAESLLQKERYEAAGELADSVRVFLKNFQKRQKQHTISSQLWIEKSREWTARTVTESKASSQPALIVDKSRHFLYILKKGQVIDSLACELGYNSGHQKRVSGDGATPEGMYRVVRINKASKYYRALVLDYPNKDDKLRFQSNLEAGSIPPDSKIGSLIEIHGHGGQGRDWTDGCVAVTDRNMDRLLHLVPVGAAVTIVRIWKERR
ncbi:MAG: L,D-transpeptidase family protein [Candidatus Zixiibacteriota bacterium]